MMATQRAYTDADRAKMRKLYSKHGNAAAVAREMGCSQNVVRCAVSDSYLEHRRRLTREYHRASYVPRDRARVRVERDAVSAEEFTPLYDPRRDGDPQYASLAAELLGDPPAGRRAMLAAHASLETYSADEDDRDVGC